ncbi:MAG: ribosomal protein S18-alanine N-acetyltransferase [Clostridiales bacterium]|jgi:ribosomal-protein-alanine N-acetyltransferase|nr:ribosomal protein S18-alanine N-acetyltransferase [Clostridiales bacterium]
MGMTGGNEPKGAPVPVGAPHTSLPGEARDNAYSARISGAASGKPPGESAKSARPGARRFRAAVRPDGAADRPDDATAWPDSAATRPDGAKAWPDGSAAPPGGEGAGQGQANAPHATRPADGAEFLPARAEHIPGIHEIEKLSFASPWSRESFEREFADDLAHYFVAVSHSEVIGYCGYWSVAGEAHITNVAVHPCHRRGRVGIGLMRRMMLDIARRGIRDTTLEVREDNHAALAMYAQLGFEACGLRKNYYEKERKNAIIMWKHD